MATGDFYFPLYYKRLLASTVGWSDAEFGIYVRLLIYQFDNGSLPADINELKRIAPSIKRHWTLIEKKFTKLDTGRLINRVMQGVYNDIQEKKLTNSFNGKLGGRGKKRTVTEKKANGIEYEKRNESETKAIPIINNQQSIVSADADTAAAAAAPNSLTSEIIKSMAKKAFDDKIWADAICMGQSTTRDELKKWMAQFNASLVGDNIADFNERRYKKIFGGWLNKQKSKGYKLSEKEISSPPEKFLN